MYYHQGEGCLHHDGSMKRARKCWDSRSRQHFDNGLFKAWHFTFLMVWLFVRTKWVMRSIILFEMIFNKNLFEYEIFWCLINKHKSNKDGIFRFPPHLWQNQNIVQGVRHFSPSWHSLSQRWNSYIISQCPRLTNTLPKDWYWRVQKAWIMRSKKWGRNQKAYRGKFLVIEDRTTAKIICWCFKKSIWRIIKGKGVVVGKFESDHKIVEERKRKALQTSGRSEKISQKGEK